MSKRQLRSDFKQDPAQSLDTQPTKKQKREQTWYLCFTCDSECAASTFPEYNPSRECKHLINTCKGCLKTWVHTQIEDAHFVKGGEDGKTFGISCPQCPAVMRAVNVNMAKATKVMQQKFDEGERKHIADNTPGWRWCLASNCRAGQVHEKKAPEPMSKAPKKANKKTEPKDIEAMADICICNDCGAKACVVCDRPWHLGETCEEYQVRIKDRIEEEDKSMRKIQETAKRCPNCQGPIQKNGGCAHMYCTFCKHSFCWNCSSSPCKCYEQVPGLGNIGAGEVDEDGDL